MARDSWTTLKFFTLELQNTIMTFRPTYNLKIILFRAIYENISWNKFENCDMKYNLKPIVLLVFLTCITFYNIYFSNPKVWKLM